ncbi:MAG TPA: phospholipase D-like domain-containing protein [Caulobacteraceae bacterium]|jgi:phosphatidylserine/phosphatidylglycerophosphate/cardiolipin synthase-like enzyme|nr:phospholipase D-like domain-containing protein [Caulobacteraceae bacterium]
MGLLRAGETCWRPAQAGRARFLIDGQNYFRALDGALRAARRSIHLLGWSFDPRTRLSEDGGQIGQLLIDLAARQPGLDVRLLAWQSALPISATQGFFPHRAKARFRGTRVRFELDAEVPLGACHHQKVIVIDDALAFVGGADLAGDRWDTPEHLDDAPRRAGPGGGRHGPRHEVMAMVDGPAAAALGDLFRARWRIAVGDIGEAPPPAPPQWPAGFGPELDCGRIGVARTLPAWRDEPGAREIAELTLEAIAGAERLIYLENQYFTWPLAVEALAARLAEPDGPEVVLICTDRSPSYFDRLTMDRARSTALWRLKSGDIFRRFHALAPFTRGGKPIIAHAKVMIVDDRLVRISSANLNNRSHGFDTECEVALEAQTPAERAALGGFRDRLAGHWLGRGADEVAEMRRLTGSLGEGLWALDGGARLRPLEARRLGLFGEWVAEFHIGDPSEVGNSWRPAQRRKTLVAEARALRQTLAARAAGSPPPAAGDPRPAATADRAAS